MPKKNENFDIKVLIGALFTMGPIFITELIFQSLHLFGISPAETSLFYMVNDTHLPSTPTLAIIIGFLITGLYLMVISERKNEDVNME